MTARGVVLFAVLFAGCRGVLGIEDLTLADGGADGSTAHDSGADGGGADGAVVDAAPDAAPPCGNTTTRSECVMCCSNAHMPALNPFTMFIDQGDNCVCTGCNMGGTGPCTSTLKVCGGTMTAMGTMCIGCAVGSMIDNRCPNLTNKCTNDLGCKPLAECAATCKSLP